MNLTLTTLPTIEQNLAWDEWLLDEVDRGQEDELLRIWEPDSYAAVLGRSSRVTEEVDRDYLEENSMALHRRCSGGACVVIGPGCLLYSLILSLNSRPHLRAIDQAHAEIMNTWVNRIGRPDLNVEFHGICDLTLDGRKFSGNSLRIKRDAVLYHGTMLYNFPLERIHRSLRTPPRQPDYRQGRSHAEFVTNLPVERQDLIDRMTDSWKAGSAEVSYCEAGVNELVASRYSKTDWVLSR